MRFPYQGYPVRGVGTGQLTIAYRPMMLVRIICPAGDAIANGLLDTGADDPLLPASFLQPLGITPPAGAGASIGGVGVTVQANFAPVDLVLRRGRTTYRWSATVGFYAGYKVILGQSGALEYFLASFNHRLRQATLRPNGPLPVAGQNRP